MTRFLEVGSKLIYIYLVTVEMLHLNYSYLLRFLCSEVYEEKAPFQQLSWCLGVQAKDRFVWFWIVYFSDAKKKLEHSKSIGNEWM